jgi:hypothetical protein
VGSQFCLGCSGINEGPAIQVIWSCELVHKLRQGFLHCEGELEEWKKVVSSRLGLAIILQPYNRRWYPAGAVGSLAIILAHGNSIMLVIDVHFPVPKCNCQAGCSGTG